MNPYYPLKHTMIEKEDFSSEFTKLIFFIGSFNIVLLLCLFIELTWTVSGNQKFYLLSINITFIW